MTKKFSKYLQALTLLIVLSSVKLQALDVFAEVKAAYFRPDSNKFRRIYSDNGIYGLEVSCQAWNQFYAWTSVSYFSKRGSSIGVHDRTRIMLAPVGFGLKYLYCINRATLYLGLGALGTYLHIRDHSPYVVRKTSKWGWGGIAKAGVLVDICKSVFVDCFIDYSFTEMDFHEKHHKTIYRHRIDLNSLSVGAGLGYRF